MSIESIHADHHTHTCDRMNAIFSEEFSIYLFPKFSFAAFYCFHRWTVIDVFVSTKYAKIIHSLVHFRWAKPTIDAWLFIPTQMPNSKAHQVQAKLKISNKGSFNHNSLPYFTHPIHTVISIDRFSTSLKNFDPTKRFYSENDRKSTVQFRHCPVNTQVNNFTNTNTAGTEMGIEQHNNSDTSTTIKCKYIIFYSHQNHCGFPNKNDSEYCESKKKFISPFFAVIRMMINYQLAYVMDYQYGFNS